MKKFLLLPALAFCSLAAQAADPALSFEGDGTAASPYLIKTADDVIALATACNGATSTTSGHYAGKYFSLTADIDMAGKSGFYGIATAPADKATSTGTYHFDGIFDGCGYRIKNMKINGVVRKDDGSVNTSTSANGSRRYCGFFGAIGTGGKVSNLVIDASCRIEAYSYAGGVVGNLGTDAFVENCANYAEVVTYDGYTGGIVGCQVTSSTKTGGISNCFNAGSIRSCGSTVGGIVGRASYGELKNCANVGSVLAYNFDPVKAAFSQTKVGGIVGDNQYSRMADCFNAGDVYAMKEQAGGIAGSISRNSTKGGISNCLNVGYVYGSLGYNCGYIAGVNYSSSTVVTDLSNCYYDAQMLNTLFGAADMTFGGNATIQRLNTSRLTNGQTLAGLEGWVYKTGSYPVPSGLNYPELFTAAATYVSIPAGQNADLLTSSATASTGTTVSLERPTELFTVSGSTVTAHPSAGNGVGVLTLTNGAFTRHLLLSTYTIPFSGQGTEASPYLINNKEDLIGLANLSNGMRLQWADKHFRLTSDIDLAGETRFMGIGCSPDTVNNFAPGFRLIFRGNFNGDNHKISNWTADWVRFDADSNYIDWRKGGYYSGGFFGTLGNGAVVRNLVIDRSCKYLGYMYVGGIAIQTRGDARIENCHVGAEIIAYNRYTGGIISQDNPSTPAGVEGGSVQIANCTFTGKILANYDYTAGIIGYSSSDKTSITSCVNAGSIECRRFDTKVLGTTSTSQLNRIAGIAGAIRGRIEGCASYGPITVYPGWSSSATAARKLLGCGGIAGQLSNYTTNASLRHNFTSSQVYLPEAFSGQVQAAAIVGDFWAAAKDPVFGTSSANYADTTLCATKGLVCTFTNAPDSVERIKVFHGLATSDFTSGNAIDSLAQHFTFINGYYPMPKALAENADVRTAAATFFKIGPAQGGYIGHLLPDAVCPFNNVMPLTGILAVGELFRIENNGLRVRGCNAGGNDILTLTNGWYSTLYPIHKEEGAGIGSLTDDATDPVIATEYFTTDGLRVLRPAAGQTVIAISRTLSGRTAVAKQVVR